MWKREKVTLLDCLEYSNTCKHRNYTEQIQCSGCYSVEMVLYWGNPGLNLPFTRQDPENTLFNISDEAFHYKPVALNKCWAIGPGY